MVISTLMWWVKPSSSKLSPSNASSEKALCNFSIVSCSVPVKWVTHYLWKRVWDVSWHWNSSIFFPRAEILKTKHTLCFKGGRSLCGIYCCVNMLKTSSLTVGAGSTVWNFLFIVLVWLPSFTTSASGWILGLGENQLPPKIWYALSLVFPLYQQSFPCFCSAPGCHC